MPQLDWLGGGPYCGATWPLGVGLAPTPSITALLPGQYPPVAQMSSQYLAVTPLGWVLGTVDCPVPAGVWPAGLDDEGPGPAESAAQLGTANAAEPTMTVPPTAAHLIAVLPVIRGSDRLAGGSSVMRGTSLCRDRYGR
jgi:hypothetical protein